MTKESEASTPILKAIEFVDAMDVEVFFTGGAHAFTIKGVVAVTETIDGILTIKKTDDSFARVREWSAYDVRKDI